MKGTEKEIPRTPIRFMLRVLRPFAAGTFVVLAVVSVAQVLASSTSFFLQKLVDAMTQAPDTGTALAALRLWGAIYIGAVFSMYILWRMSGFLGIRLCSASKTYSFEMLFAYLTGHSYGYFSDRFAGSVANKVSHASNGVDELLADFLWHYYPNILGLGVTTVLLFSANVWVGVIFLLLTVTTVLLNIFLVRRRHPLVRAYAESESTLRGVVVDAITNIFAVMQYARQQFELSRVRGYVEDRRVKDLRREVSSELGLVINNALIIVALTAIAFVVYMSFQNGALTIGSVVMVIMLLWNTLDRLLFVGHMLNGFIRRYGEIEEGLDEIVRPYEVVDALDAPALEVSKGDITFTGVRFAYENQEVFRDLDLVIAPGERVGLVGHSGAGKTTLVSLLLRQHDIQRGAIRIDGHNIADVTQASLRNAIALVPQDPQLFHRSIRENIGYGREDATDEDIHHAAQRAHAEEFVATLPQGYDTLVGERGVKLSGGQRQRIAIARAILKHAPILILDEATSALDSASEVAIQEALHELMEGKTVIAIAHRLSTLREMDRIVVLKDGSVAESGTHDELLALKGIYAELWSHQVGGFIQE